MGMLKEFKEFAMKGNLIDFAIGVVIGGAFGKVVSAFVDGMVMPAVGLLTGGVDFSKKQFQISDGTKDVLDAAGTMVTKGTEPIFVKYGMFINTLVDFIVVAFVMFMVIKAMNAAKRKEEAAPAAPAPTPANEVLLAEIRDLLKK